MNIKKHYIEIRGFYKLYLIRPGRASLLKRNFCYKIKNNFQKIIKIIRNVFIVLLFIFAWALVTCAISKEPWLFWSLWVGAGVLGQSLAYLQEILWKHKFSEFTVNLPSIATLLNNTETYSLIKDNNRNIPRTIFFIAVGIFNLIGGLSGISEILEEDLN